MRVVRVGELREAGAGTVSIGRGSKHVSGRHRATKRTAGTARGSIATRITAVVLGGVMAFPPLNTPQAAADPADVQQIIDELEATSRDVEAHNEQIEATQISLDEEQQRMDERQAKRNEARARAEQLQAEANRKREAVNEVARTRFKVGNGDIVSKLWISENPQQVIEKRSFLNALRDNAEAQARAAAKETRIAADEFADVESAEATARFEIEQLRKKQQDLEKEREELKSRTDEIRARVDALSPADRQVWIEKDGPVHYSIEGLTGTNPLGMSALEAAMSKIGSPYEWGAIGPSAFDCSGLMYWAYQQQGITIPRTSSAQMAGGTPLSRGELQPGDIVGYYAGASHVGMYAGNGMIVHASDYGIPVQVVPLDSAPIYGYRRY